MIYPSNFTSIGKIISKTCLWLVFNCCNWENSHALGWWTSGCLPNNRIASLIKLTPPCGSPRKCADGYTTWYMCWTNQLLQFSTLRRRHNGGHFPDDIYKHIFWEENCGILMKISLKFVLQDPANNIPTLVQIIWHWSGNKPLSDPMLA